MSARISPVKAFGALVVGAIFMGFSPIFVRLADVGPFASAFWRVALALPPLWLWMRTAGESAPIDTAAYRKAVFLAGIAFTGDLIFWHLSILHTTVANATLLATTAPVWVFVVSFFFFGQRLRRIEIAGLLVCLAGGAMLIRDSFEINPVRLRGDMEALATSVFFGLYIVFIGRARGHAGPAKVTFWSTLVTALVLLVVAVAAEGNIFPATVQGWLPLLGLALLSQAAGQGLLALALGNLPVAFSSLVVFLEAVAAALLGWVVLKEALGPWQWAGGALVLLGIWLARPRSRSDRGGRAEHSGR
jgi:drug/metabolite transporter (DMT)-like permease